MLARLLLLVVSVCLLTACGGAKKRPLLAEHAPVATRATELPVSPLADGPAQPLSEVIRGKVAVVDLWATWCSACREVSKNAELLARVHPQDKLVVVGLSVGEERDVVARFLAGKAPPHPIYLDPEVRVADAFGAKELPTIVVFDRQGRVVAQARKIDLEIVRLVDRLVSAP